MWKLPFKNKSKTNESNLEAELLQAYQIANINEHESLVKFFNNAASRVFQGYNSELGCATIHVDNLVVNFALQNNEVEHLQAMVKLGKPELVLSIDEVGYMRLTCLLESWVYSYSCYSARTATLY